MKICPSCSARQANDVLVCSSCGYAWGDAQPKRTMMGIPAVFDGGDGDSGARSGEGGGDGGGKHTLFGIPAMRGPSKPIDIDPGATEELSASHVAEAIRKARAAHLAAEDPKPKPLHADIPEDSTREVSARELASVLGVDRIGRPANRPAPVATPVGLKTPTGLRDDGGGAKHTAFGLPAITSSDASGPSAPAEEPRSRSTMFGLPMISADQRPDDDEDRDSPTQNAFGAAFVQRPGPGASSLDESSDELRTQVAGPGMFVPVDDEYERGGMAASRLPADEPAQPRHTMMGMSLADLHERAAEQEQEAASAKPVSPVADPSKKKKLLDKVRALKKSDPEGASSQPAGGLPKPSIPKPSLPKPSEPPAPSGVLKAMKKDRGDRETEGMEDPSVGGLGTYKVARGTSDSTREFPFGEVQPSVKKLRLDPTLQDGQEEGEEPAELAAIPEASQAKQRPGRTAFPTGPSSAPASPAQDEVLPELSVEPEFEALPELGVEPMDFGAERAQMHAPVTPQRMGHSSPGPVAEPRYSIHDAIEDELFDEPGAGVAVESSGPSWAPTPMGHEAPGYGQGPMEGAVEYAQPAQYGQPVPAGAAGPNPMGAKLQKIGGIFAGLLLLVGGGLGLSGVATGSAIGFVGVAVPMVAGLLALALPFLPLGGGARNGGFVVAALIGLGGFGAAMVADVAGLGPFIQLSGALMAVFAAVIAMVSKAK